MDRDAIVYMSKTRQIQESYHIAIIHSLNLLLINV